MLSHARAARLLAAAAAAAAAVLPPSGTAAAGGSPAAPDFGPNVKIFDPSMSTAQIKAVVDQIATQQVTDQFGANRYALLFMPGTYGSPTPLSFNVGYYTQVAGLGASPNDVTINGTVDSMNQCFA